MLHMDHDQCPPQMHNEHSPRIFDDLQYPQNHYVVAQLDHMKDAAQVGPWATIAPSLAPFAALHRAFLEPASCVRKPFWKFS